MVKNFFSFLFDLLKIVTISLVIILPVRHFLIQPFYVKGASMEPNFHDHEYLIIDEITYRFSEPKRGDVVVFRYPHNPQEFFIKRIIGLPGETIKVSEGNIIITNPTNPEGIILSEKYLPENLKTYSMSGEDVLVLESSEYFVLGDNRNSSKDSRSFGPINKSAIIGRVLFRGWPFDKITLFIQNEPVYNF